MATQSAPAKKRATKPKSRQKITEHFSRHYFALMPEKKHHRIIVWVVFFALSALIAVQVSVRARSGGRPIFSSRLQ
jgi:helix-turn-helix protein